MPCTNEDLRRYIEMFFEDEAHHHEDIHEVEYRKVRALEAFDAIAHNAERYSWLRAGNGYAPEEAMVRGGEDLDKLCDEGVRDGR